MQDGDRFHRHQTSFSECKRRISHEMRFQTFEKRWAHDLFMEGGHLMSLAAEYRKEREDIETLEFESGFITFKFLPSECYIVDIYVKPEARRSGYGSLMANQVKSLAKRQGYQLLTGSVNNRLPSATRSAEILKR